ncbi:YidC/Oxa1 family membrane protein insertase [Paenibacillus ehimensis]|uniref:YidC/Oxa1 family membrane protein insertase n=1 Tax=Paenibacillus ehimensis TaxID=79264 RepID=A0ABT8VJG1_9BACL|nr:YidC/Oxa1 family membrane protein insertase [Paenibacillus ehimensis]MDO3681138.1 YidC/Oxa1 family membrane protein insertase [Paenibacillus ehimensis]MEC0212502.1 YidC/Oxa1 family membrane protein insertase [Paenibacillus ehimensis]
MYTWFQPIIDLLAYVLSWTFEWTRDWGAAVIVLTLLVKGALYRFNLLAARQQVRSAAAFPELSKLRETCGNDPAKLVQETTKVYGKYGINPLSSPLSAIIQMPVLMAMYGLFLTHGSTMTSILIPWVAHLAEADPFHLIPIATGLLSFAVGMIPLADAAAVSMSGSKRLLFGTILLLIPLVITWRAPVALGLYWLSGSVFSLLERLFYRTSAGKRLLRRGLPEAAAT